MRRRKKNRTYIVALGLVAVAALAVGAWYYRDGKTPCRRHRTRHAHCPRVGRHAHLLAGAGSLVAEAEMDIGFETSGRWRRSCAAGRSGRAGRVLARLDRADAEGSDAS